MFSRWRCFALAAATTIVAACGGSDGSSDSGASGSLIPGNSAYTGSTAPAILTAENAVPLALGALNGIEFSAPIPSLAASAKRNDNDTARLMVLTKTFEKVFASYFESNDSAAQARSVYDRVLLGGCGGSVEFAVERDDTSGDFSGPITFKAYCDDGVTYNGATSTKGRFDVAADRLQQLEITFDALEISSTKGLFGAKGAATYNYFSDEHLTVSMDLVLTGASSGKTYWYRNYNISSSYSGLAIYGTFFHPDFGYVTVATQLPLVLSWEHDGFVRGRLSIVGAVSARAEMASVTDELFRVATDSNGDGVFDEKTSPVSWIDFQPVAGTVPAVPQNVSLVQDPGYYNGTLLTASWAPVLNATGYRIYIAPSSNVTPENFLQLGGALYEAEGTTWSTTLAPGTYYIVVAAENLFGESGLSSELQVDIAAPDPGVDPEIVQAIKIEQYGDPVADGYVIGHRFELNRVVMNGYGSSIYVDADALEWSSSDTNVALVDSRGLVTAVGSGTANITARYQGVTSNELPIVVRSDITPLSLDVNEMVYVPETGKIYASVPSRFGANGNSIAVIDPRAAKVESYVYVGSEPNVLALSPDHTTLYVALDGAQAIRSFDVASNVAGAQFSLASIGGSSSQQVLRMVVSPTNATTVAAVLGNRLFGGDEGIVAIYDQGVPRAQFSAERWRDIAFTSGTRLVALRSYGYTDGALLTVRLDATGIVGTTPVANSQFDAPARFVLQGDKLYFSDGRLFDLASSTILGTYSGASNTTAPLVLDSGANRVYGLAGYGYGEIAHIYVYQQDKYLPLGVIEVPAPPGSDGSGSLFGDLLKWSEHGYAFSTNDGRVFVAEFSTSP